MLHYVVWLTCHHQCSSVGLVPPPPFSSKLPPTQANTLISLRSNVPPLAPSSFLIIFSQIAYGFDIVITSYLAIKAWWKGFNSLMLKFSLLFTQILSQATACTPLPTPLWHHRKNLKYFSSFSRMPRGTYAHDIRYLGIDCNIALSNVILPAKDGDLASHEEIFSNMKSNVLIGSLFIPLRTAWYVKGGIPLSHTIGATISSSL